VLPFSLGEFSLGSEASLSDLRFFALQRVGFNFRSWILDRDSFVEFMKTSGVQLSMKTRASEIATCQRIAIPSESTYTGEL
jgi:hypothetical protein